jgi:hypothetical protein
VRRVDRRRIALVRRQSDHRDLNGLLPVAAGELDRAEVDVAHPSVRTGQRRYARLAPYRHTRERLPYAQNIGKSLIRSPLLRRRVDNHN